MTEGVHKPFTDDGVTYCGWDGHEGCGEVWPCSYVRASGPRATLARLTGYAEDSRTVQAFLEVVHAFAADELRSAAEWCRDRSGIWPANELDARADELDPR